MSDSILITIKQMLGIEEDDTSFDAMIIPLINANLANLAQIGVGPSEGFTIMESEETWDRLIGDRKDLEHVKAYIYYRVKTVFDPPSSGAAMEAMKQMADKYEWLLNVRADNSIL